jgi:hypothetical protein
MSTRAIWHRTAGVAIALLGILGSVDTRAEGANGQVDPFRINPEAERSIDLNQLFHGTFSSVVRDGKYEGSLDSRRPYYVPTMRAQGTLFSIPKKGEFDSVRINVLLARDGVTLGELQGGIIYWRGDTCVIAFGALQKMNGQFIGVRGYFPVSSLPAQPAIPSVLRPGMSVFVPGESTARIPIVVDHTLNPPSDEADDD